MMMTGDSDVTCCPSIPMCSTSRVARAQGLHYAGQQRFDGSHVATFFHDKKLVKIEERVVLVRVVVFRRQ